MSGFEDTRVRPLPPLPDGYSEKSNGRCRTCQGTIRWGRHTSGRMIPFNLDGTRHGDNVAPEVRPVRDAGNPGAAAAIAVVEVARKVRCDLAQTDRHPDSGYRCGECLACELKVAVEAFDQAIGVSR